MPQRVLTGTTGSVTGLNCRLYLWDCTLHTDALESTGFGSSWRNNEPGFRSASGRAAARLTDGTATDDPTAMFDGAKHALTLVAATSCSFSFSAIITNVSVAVNVDKISEVTFDFVSDGAITTAWLQS